MVKFLTVFILLVVNLCSIAQVKFRHEASVEFTGRLALRYDYMFNRVKRGFWDVGAAVGTLKPHSDYHFMDYQTYASYNFGREYYFFELGISLRAVDITDNRTLPPYAIHDGD